MDKQTKVVITITDREDGGVSVSTTFDPPAKREEGLTPAQVVAFTMLGAAMPGDDDESDNEDEED